MNWHDRYKAMLKGLGWSNKDIAKMSGFTRNSVKSMTQPNKEKSGWLKIAIIVYEKYDKLLNSKVSK